MLYFATRQVVSKSELNISASIACRLYLIDADSFNSDLFCHHFNAEKQLQKYLVVIVLVYSICRIYSNSHSLLKVCQL